MSLPIYSAKDVVATLKRELGDGERSAAKEVNAQRLDEYVTAATGRRNRRGTFVVLSLLLFVWVGNVVDLFFTLKVGETVPYSELNPIAAKFNESPTFLVLYKTTLLIIGTGIIYHLRQHRAARFGAIVVAMMTGLLIVQWAFVAVELGLSSGG